jgi:DNA-binding transcriptional MerR regulator
LVAERYSKAVVELAAAASALGGDVSPRQIERWHQAGVIPDPDRKYPGHGSTATYAEDSARQAAEVHTLLSEGWRLEEVAVPLFLRRFDVQEPVVKSAFKAHAQYTRRRITRRAPTPDAGNFTIAEAATKTLLRSFRGDRRIAEWRDRVKGREDSPSSIVESAFMTFVHLLLTGEPISTEGLSEFYTASGMEGMVKQMSMVLGETVELSEFDELIKQLDLARYEELVDEFTLDELMSARSVLAELVNACIPIAELLAETAGLVLPDDFKAIVTDAAESMLSFGLPVGAWALRRNAAGTDEVVAALRANALAIEGMPYLLEHLPKEYWRFLGPNSQEELDAASEEERGDAIRITQQAFEQDERLRRLRDRAIDAE